MKIKKILKTAASLLISAALLTGTIPAVSASAADYYIKATTAQTNVRKGPGTEYKAIGKIKGTGKLTYVDAKFDKNYILWYKVKFKNGKTGWISSDYTRRYIKKSALPDVEHELLASDGSAYGDIYEQISVSANEANAVGVQVAVIRGSDGQVFDWTYGWADYGEQEMTSESKNALRLPQQGCNRNLRR